MFRVGIGYDAHRFKSGRDLILGGVKIPFDLGLDGHSDADVLIHAIIDAILGAAALGDIGTHFPDTSDEFKGISSLKLLRRVRHLIRLDYEIVNIDSVIVAQRPKLSAYFEDMRKNISSACEIAPSLVSVKATTTEKMGFEGRGEGISARAVVLLRKL